MSVEIGSSKSWPVPAHLHGTDDYLNSDIYTEKFVTDIMIQHVEVLAVYLAKNSRAVAGLIPSIGSTLRVSCAVL